MKTDFVSGSKSHFTDLPFIIYILEVDHTRMTIVTNRDSFNDIAKTARDPKALY